MLFLVLVPNFLVSLSTSPQPPPSDIKHRPRAQGQRDGLKRQQCAHIVPEVEDQRDRRKDRLDVVGQPGADLFALDFLHEAALAGIPDGQVDLSQVGHVGAMRGVQVEGQRGEVDAEEDDQNPERDFGPAGRG